MFCAGDGGGANWRNFCDWGLERGLGVQLVARARNRGCNGALKIRTFRADRAGDGPALSGLQIRNVSLAEGHGSVSA